MNRKDLWAIVAHAVPTVGLLFQGLLYVTTPRFMPYHADALGVAWEDLPANYQGFLLGVLKAMGAGSIGVAAALLILLFLPFREGRAWARWAVPAVGVLFTALIAYAAFTIDMRTPASPPWRQTCGLAALYLAGALLSYWPQGQRVAACWLGALLLAGSTAAAQELDPRTYSPSPVGTTIVLSGFGKSVGGFILDPSLGIENVEADLWFTTTGVGYVFDLGGRQARMLAVFPAAWGDISGEVGREAQRQDLEGLTDPRFKLTVGLAGAPALTLDELARAPRRTIVGASLIVVPPWGQYDSARLVNLGYNRWAFKPEVGISRPVGRFTLEGYAGVWLFTTNGAYYPGHAERRQDPIISLQGHAAYALPGRAWLALDATWFSGGQTDVDGIASPDRQSNSRLGATLSVPITRLQSLKLVYSTGAATRRGSDFDTFSVTWQAVRFGKERRL